MGKSLVIVESPAKAKTINKYLGSKYVVKSSVGHVRDLPTSSTAASASPEAKTKAKAPINKKIDKVAREKQNLVRRMGIDPYNDWQVNYEILPGKEKVIAELKKAAANVDHIYLATDLDREGEAIAWHLQEVIGGDSERYSRVIFNEITKNAIQDAFAKPININQDHVNAQQMRRFLDRVVGFMVSPLLWKKIARGLSAGRVQSVALKLLVDREHEIKSFVPQEFWQLIVNTSKKDEKAKKNKEVISFEITSIDKKKLEIVPNQKQAKQIIADLEKQDFIVVDKEHKPTKINPRAPFITSTLQQAASTRLGFSLKRTMNIAQRLYEAGYITYMRTDSTNISKEALVSVRNFISENYGPEYLPAKANFYSSKESAQEAHEAIRPSYIETTGAKLIGMDISEVKLYELIRNQFIACQMPPAQYTATAITVQAGKYALKTRGRVLVFDGWTKVMRAIGKNPEDKLIPELEIGEHLSYENVDAEQCFTKPPARYGEASLVKTLEKCGIGRPSTYATIISTIQDRGYVQIRNKRFYVEKIGEIVASSLVKSFPDLINLDFTAQMEDSLDQIAGGKLNWKQKLTEFFKKFEQELATAELDESKGGMPANTPVEVEGISCKLCKRNMTIRVASTGVFLGCSGYALPAKERCKETINLIPEVEALNILDDAAETNALLQKKRCPLCDVAMDSYLIDQTRKLYICGNNPACAGYLLETGTYKVKGYDGPIVECDKCQSDMHLKSGRFGNYMGCSNSECKNTRKILKSGEIAPPKEDPIAFPELKCEKSDAYFVLRDGASGLFMAAHNFPKSRETRSPKIVELIKYKERLPEKFTYLTKAPAKDPDGNEAIVRFSRKQKQQYITSEVKGKPSKWRLYYQNGKWAEST